MRCFSNIYPFPHFCGGLEFTIVQMNRPVACEMPLWSNDAMSYFEPITINPNTSSYYDNYILLHMQRISQSDRCLYNSGAYIIIAR